ncbi:MAG: putative ABC transporter substrate-binding protein YesO [Firmicutes bacterium ADurb.Bin419]|nr:MAG: putative ABC transporter substrate-binding protein YesO [Firmicutes bacterium ADurb.Bin419]
MKKKFLVLLCLILCLLIVLPGCSAGKADGQTPNNASTEKNNKQQTDSKSADTPAVNNEPVTLKIAWWGAEGRAEKTNKVIELFKKKFPHVTIETDYADFKTYFEKMTAYSLSGQLPDVMQQDYAYIGQYSTSGLLEDLTPFISSKTINTSDINEATISSGTIDGKVFGIALGVNCHNVIYDPEAFKKANVKLPSNSWTWDEYKTTISELFKNGGYQSTVPYQDDPKILVEYWARSAGKSLYNADGTSLGFDDPKLLENLFSEIQTLVKTSSVYDPVLAATLKDQTGKSPLAEGKAFCHYSWSNLAVSEAISANKDFELVALPKVPSGDNAGMYLKPSMFFSITKTAAQKETAAKFIDFFINDTEANNILAADRGIPVSSKIRAEVSKTLDGVAKKTMEYIDSVSGLVSPIDPPEPKGADSVRKLISEVYNELLAEKLTPADAANKVFAGSNEILAKNKK